MSKSAIYMADTASNAVAVGENVPLGSTVRRFGCNIRGNGNAVTTMGGGYYRVSFTATIAPTAAGTAVVTLMRDGSPVQGAVASTTATAAAQPQTVGFSAIVRDFQCACGSSANLTVQLTGADSLVSSAAIEVEKL